MDRVVTPWRGRSTADGLLWRFAISSHGSDRAHMTGIDATATGSNALRTFDADRHTASDYLAAWFDLASRLDDDARREIQAILLRVHEAFRFLHAPLL